MMRRHLILASKSPRREYLLKQAGLSFTVIPSGIDEKACRHLCPETYVKTLAKAKAMDISEKYPESWVIGADTIVLSDDHVLEKPENINHARTMLRQLSGTSHDVFTGYCVCCHSEAVTISDVIKTKVHFKHLADEEIEWYIHTDEPFDKAGAYAIQGLGTFLVKRIDGSYTNVVGLPVCEIIEILIQKKVVGLNVSGPGFPSAAHDCRHHEY